MRRTNGWCLEPEQKIFHPSHHNHFDVLFKRIFTKKKQACIQTAGSLTHYLEKMLCVFSEQINDFFEISEDISPRSYRLAGIKLMKIPKY